MEKLISLEKIESKKYCCKFGGKAYGLYKLNEFGFNVPESAVILYDTPITDKLVQEIKLFIEKFPDGLFSIRSSGLNEDGTSNSFAGMYKTFLNVKKNEVINKVMECRNYSSDRVVKYSDYNGIQFYNCISVIIQRMLKPSISGVGFTIDPIQGNTNEMVIETVAGVGESLVSGESTPNYYKIDKFSTQVIEQSEIDICASMSNQQINSIVVNLLKAEQCFEKPMDIEFAFEEDILYILQARPVTTVTI